MEEAQYDLEMRLNKAQWDATLRSMSCVPRVADTLLTEAIVLHQEGDYEAAEALLNADEHVEDDTAALNTRGLVRLGREDFEGALSDFAQTIQLLNDRLSALHVNRAATFIQMRCYEAALQSANEAKHLAPQWAGPWENLLSVHCRQGTLDTAFCIAEEMKSAWPGWCEDTELAQYLVEDIDLRPLRSDPRFNETFAMLLRRRT